MDDIFTNLQKLVFTTKQLIMSFGQTRAVQEHAVITIDSCWLWLSLPIHLCNMTVQNQIVKKKNKGTPRGLDEPQMHKNVLYKCKQGLAHI